MLALRLVLTAVAPFIFLGPAFGQMRLEWKLKEGDQFFLETANALKHTIKSTSAVIGEDSTTVEKYRVVKQDADQLVFEKTLLSRQVKSVFGGSGDNTEAEKKLGKRNAEIAAKLEGAVCTITVDPRTGAVKEVRGINEHIARAFADKPDLGSIITADVGAKAVKDQVESLFAATVPDRPVEPGQKWQRKTIISFGTMGEFNADGNYTYRGKSDLDGKPLEQIEVVWNLGYVPPGDNSGLPYKVKSADLKTQTAAGTYYFNATQGRLVQFRRTVQVRGTLDIVLGTEESAIGVEGEQTSTVKLMDKDPSSK